METTLLLVTPPFTQLNTPYPATAYLKGFLNTKGISSHQIDLGLETVLKIFCKPGLESVFHQMCNKKQVSVNTQHMLSMKEAYLQTIDHVIRFLQGKNPTLALHISQRDFLPEASRFKNLEFTEWAFGKMGIQDLAKHLCTLYLEDIADLIKENIDPHFGFSRYAEKLARSAFGFDELEESLHLPPTYTDRIYLEILTETISLCRPKLVAFSVPFPGNLYSALRCGQHIREKMPEIPIAMGGGFPNTELRSLKDPRVFQYLDYIMLDDGEAPMERLIAFIEGKSDRNSLKRTFLQENGNVVYEDDNKCKDYKMSETGTPDYSGLPLDQYISVLEIANPMHRLWNDGRWNKLTMAHGCYWGKCTFCDISLDYIKIYEPIAASIICDRMETLIRETGVNGFHFVDEAAPPSLMKALAIEIIKRKLVVSWWTNVRFEKSFTRDLCLLLRASGCIAVSGGLEVASDRLLGLINKGITVAQVAKVNRNFTESGIMVHAYLMYGFPTQTDQETIDSLEMVRQLFRSGVLQSGFWHQFTMTAHSPVGLEPAKFKVEVLPNQSGDFANNDMMHRDPMGAKHERYGDGLKISIYNYLQQAGLDEPLQKWFDFRIPKTSVSPDHIEKILLEREIPPFNPNQRIIWLGSVCSTEPFIKSKKGHSWQMIRIILINRKNTLSIELEQDKGIWLLQLLETLNSNPTGETLGKIKNDFESSGFDDFELFWDNKPISNLYQVGLLRV